MSWLLRIVVNALALVVAAWLVPGIGLGDGTTQGVIVSALVVGLVFGVINALVRPVVKLLSLPLIILTLGLFLIVINALMLQLTSAVAGGLGLDFHVARFFWDAVLGALVITAVSMVADALLPDPA